MVRAIVAASESGEESITELLGDVPATVQGLNAKVRVAADEFFAAYDNREWAT